ncbi:MAG: hypothetical protein IT384_14805 [Deltaproteobacteria bacterium]|nr:hypothetical protein [Deltaproteobacteria bacterium]
MINRIVGMGVVLAVVGCGESAPIEALGDSGARDGKSDAGSGDARGHEADATTADGSSADVGSPDASSADASTEPCTDYCRTALPCRAENAIAELGDRVFGSRAQCTYPARDAAEQACIEVCRGADPRHFPNGVPAACVRCEQVNLERSCRRSSAWRDCRAECGPDVAFGIGWMTQLLTDDLVCWPSPGPREPPPTCRGGSSYVGMYLLLDGKPFGSALTGSGTIAALDPLLLHLADGSTLTVSLTGVSSSAISLGDAVEVTARGVCPFWCEGNVVLRRPSGALLLAAWSGARVMVPSLPEIRLEYRAADCPSVRSECAGLLAGELFGYDAAGAEARVLPGHSARLGAYELIQGPGQVYFEVLCTDLPGEFVTGAVVGP